MLLPRGTMDMRCSGGIPGVSETTTARAADTAARRRLATLSGSGVPARPITRLSITSRIRARLISCWSFRTCAGRRALSALVQRPRGGA